LDAIVVPLVDIQGANYQAKSMQPFHQQHHLQAPTNSKKQKVKMCCLWCGGEKTAGHHKVHAPTKSA
jgi:hypothetical protein